MLPAHISQPYKPRPAGKKHGLATSERRSETTLSICFHIPLSRESKRRVKGTYFSARLISISSRLTLRRLTLARQGQNRRKPNMSACLQPTTSKFYRGRRLASCVRHESPLSFFFSSRFHLIVSVSRGASLHPPCARHVRVRRQTLLGFGTTPTHG